MMQRQVALAALLIMLGNVASRLLGLVREQVMAWLFGASGATDAFVAASAVPMIVYDLLIGGAISAALVPIFVDHVDDDGRLSEVLSSLLTLAAAALVCVTLILMACAPLIMSVLGGGFDPAQREQSIGMVRVMLVAVIFQGLAGVLMAALYARQQFASPAFAPALYNGAIVLGALLLHSILGVESLVAGVVLGAMLQLLLQIVSLRRLRFRPTLGLSRPEVRAALRLYAPVAGGMVVTIAGIVIDRYLASLLEDGSMTIMNYATRLIQFPLGLVGVALSAAILPSLSSYASAEGKGEASRWTEYRASLISGIRLTLFLMTPALVAVVVLRDPLVQLVFERGRFTIGDTARTALVLMAYAPQLPFTAMDQLLIVAFYARKDTRTPVLVGVVTVLLYLVSALLMVQPFGVVGLALANAIQNSAHGLILLVLLERVVRSIVTPDLGRYVLCVTVAGMLMAVVQCVGVTSLGTLHLPALLLLIVLGGAGLLAYILASMLLRVDEPRYVLQLIQRRLGRGGR